MLPQRLAQRERLVVDQRIAGLALQVRLHPIPRGPSVHRDTELPLVRAHVLGGRVRVTVVDGHLEAEAGRHQAPDVLTREGQSLHGLGVHRDTEMAPLPVRPPDDPFQGEAERLGQRRMRAPQVGGVPGARGEVQRVPELVQKRGVMPQCRARCGGHPHVGRRRDRRAERRAGLAGPCDVVHEDAFQASAEAPLSYGGADTGERAAGALGQDGTRGDQAGVSHGRGGVPVACPPAVPAPEERGPRGVQPVPGVDDEPVHLRVQCPHEGGVRREPQLGPRLGVRVEPSPPALAQPLADVRQRHPDLGTPPVVGDGPREGDQLAVGERPAADLGGDGALEQP
ncbi:hypothetical protein Sme01_33870 [Sphaerisporangium melleum]|uniref:Uncharacterized protein n=1 Tax=Sphaerisporangium melleum TaxID=321316 RepID=A0A917QY33_9ACTN|nr:hypothetical protein GCM10007964_16550 [Sphaerisporangium melleum]GII70911.1 hypothetical protein Sme01_33870 [Sphaerisporangium melleum]